MSQAINSSAMPEVSSACAFPINAIGIPDQRYWYSRSTLLVFPINAIGISGTISRGRRGTPANSDLSSK
jgi:hypothetical protein